MILKRWHVYKITHYPHMENYNLTLFVNNNKKLPENAI